MELPVPIVRETKLDEELLVDINFARVNETNEQWGFFDGTYLIESNSSFYNLVLD